MPELPEVETVVRGLRAPLVGQRIQRMWHDWERSIHSPPPAEFAARVAGQRVRAIQRRAKYILIELEYDVLIVHLKMTGRLYVSAAADVQPADKWVHVRFDLDGGQQLRFSDPRKFGRVYLTAESENLLGHLGPEPLEAGFTLAQFRGRLRGRRGMLKPLLLDQRFIAGIGNIYADEALFRARIHPQTSAAELSRADSAALHQTIRAVLADGIRHEGASIGWYRKPDGTKGSSQQHFAVYGREGEACPRCGGVVHKIRVAQRGTHYCPSCQPKRT